MNKYRKPLLSVIVLGACLILFLASSRVLGISNTVPGNINQNNQSTYDSVGEIMYENGSDYTKRKLITDKNSELKYKEIQLRSSIKNFSKEKRLAIIESEKRELNKWAIANDVPIEALNFFNPIYSMEIK